MTFNPATEKCRHSASLRCKYLELVKSPSQGASDVNLANLREFGKRRTLRIETGLEALLEEQIL